LAFPAVSHISSLVAPLSDRSADAVEKQTRFVNEHKLTYRVLSDADGTARKAYQVGKAAFGLIDGT
jgi:peroxiredoxin